MCIYRADAVVSSGFNSIRELPIGYHMPNDHISFKCIASMTNSQFSLICNC